MKKIISIALLMLLFVTAKSQTLTLSGPTTAASGEDIIFTFQGETSARFVSFVSIDFLNSTYPSYIFIAQASNFQVQSGNQGSKFKTNASFSVSSNTAASITLRINYTYNGTSGAGNATINKTVSISPPPIPPAPVGPTSSQNQITFTNGAAVSASGFSGQNFPLIQWINSKGIANYQFYMEASSVSNFSTVSQSQQIPSWTFGNGSFLSPSSPVGALAFTQDTYIRMKFVYGGQNYYSNVLFVPLNSNAPPIVAGPLENQNQLVLSAGSNISSFSITNQAISQFILDNGISPNQYTISYAYWESPIDANVIEVNRPNLSNTDFTNAGLPNFSQKAYVRMNFYYNNNYYYSNVVEIPQL